MPWYLLIEQLARSTPQPTASIIKKNMIQHNTQTPTEWMSLKRVPNNESLLFCGQFIKAAQSESN